MFSEKTEVQEGGMPNAPAPAQEICQVANGIQGSTAGRQRAAWQFCPCGSGAKRMGANKWKVGQGPAAETLNPQVHAEGVRAFPDAESQPAGIEEGPASSGGVEAAKAAVRVVRQVVAQGRYVV